MFLYKIGIVGMWEISPHVKEDEMFFTYVLSDDVSSIEKWMDKSYGKDVGLCLNYVKFIQNMEEYNTNDYG